MDKVTRVLAGCRYVLLITFRRNGTPVPTPVWVVGDGGSLAIQTEHGSGKAKRIRQNGRVEVAPCDVRGKPLGASVPARARLLPDEELPRVQQLLIRKYGLQARAADLLFRGRQRAAISVSLQ